MDTFKRYSRRLLIAAGVAAMMSWGIASGVAQGAGEAGCCKATKCSQCQKCEKDCGKCCADKEACKRCCGT